jgi:hypothetical protein
MPPGPKIQRLPQEKLQRSHNGSRRSGPISQLCSLHRDMMESGKRTEKALACGVRGHHAIRHSQSGHVANAFANQARTFQTSLIDGLPEDAVTPLRDSCATATTGKHARLTWVASS